VVVECPEWALPIDFDQEHCIAASGDARKSPTAGSNSHFEDLSWRL
jgi:hypothetical protein